jgi:hypothetical protein
MDEDPLIAEDIASCLMCNTTFETHEERFVHTCAQIKTESNELDNEKQTNSFDPENFKSDMNPDFLEHNLIYGFKGKKEKKSNMIESKNVSGEDSDYSPIKKKQVKRNTTKKQIQKRLSCEKTDQKKNFGKQKSFQPIVDPKKETSELEYEDQFDFCENYDLELTEEFITLILKQVDDLCENIQNGDPNMDRTLEVNQNLNNAVHCYRTHYAKNRNKNSVDNYYVIKAEGQEYYDHTEVYLDSDYKEIQYDNKNEEKSRLTQKLKGGPARKASVDKKYELVKNQCGKHGVTSMSLMLNMANNTLKNRIKVDGIVFKEKKIDDCYFCEMKKNNENIRKDLLYQFMIYDNDKNNFKCSVCQFSTKNRCNMFTHIRSIHKNEIIASTNLKIVERNDCGNTSCKKLYGILDNQKYWCKKCIELSQMPKPDFLQPAPKTVKNQLTLCPECGKSVTILKKHLRDVHGEKQKCPHCDLLTVRLKDHIYQVHEKKPCPDCGKLFTDFRMKMHIMSVHTPDDQKKFKCEFCVKGFAMKIQLTDHRHIHTGEKPYKCKFCSACFASKGNHLAHQKSHLGYRRNYAKK